MDRRTKATTDKRHAGDYGEEEMMRYTAKEAMDIGARIASKHERNVIELMRDFGSRLNNRSWREMRWML